MLDAYMQRQEEITHRFHLWLLLFCIYLHCTHHERFIAKWFRNLNEIFHWLSVHSVSLALLAGKNDQRWSKTKIGNWRITVICADFKGRLV